MQFEYTSPQTELERLIGGHHCINAFGSIEPEDDRKFVDFLERTKAPPRTTVYINSSGGDVEAAIGIGRAIRENWFSTSIGMHHLSGGHLDTFIIPRMRKPGKCLSAATLVFLGGRLRYLPDDGEFGVHQFSFRNPAPEHVGRSQILSAKIARYLSDMGLGADFLELSSSVPSSSLRPVDRQKLVDLRVVTGDQTEVTWTTQARGKMLYVRGERDSLYGHHKVMLCYSKNPGFIFWSVIEAQGREETLTQMGLVELIVDGDDAVFDISDRCSRFTYGMYVHVIANISDAEAKIIAYSRSFGVRIRFSSNAPLFLGVDAMSTEGGQEMLETFYEVLGSSND